MKRSVADQRIRNLERALRQERLGLIAVTLAFLQESPSPERLLERLERMVEAAALDPRTPAKMASTLQDGLALVRRAMEQELGKPQGLFEPHVGHVNGAEARALANPPVEQPLSLLAPAVLTQDREAAARQVRAVLIQALGQGPAADDELAARYAALGGPSQTRAALYQHRVELHRLGRIRPISSDRDVPIWGLTEQQQSIV